MTNDTARRASRLNSACGCERTCSRAMLAKLPHYEYRQLDMLPLILACLLCAAIEQPGAAPCSQSKSRTAFVSEVANGMPATMQDDFCDSRSSLRLTAFPDETGVTHYVLPGFIPKNLLGAEGESWRVVFHNEEALGSAQVEAAVLHLWLRAACTGYSCMLMPARACCSWCSFLQRAVSKQFTSVA